LICSYAQALPSILEKDYLPCFLWLDFTKGETLQAFAGGKP
jgi:hypothetical protein